MKKAISLLLCLALGAALLAGCGKAAPESGTEETAAHSPVTETAEPAGETTAETSPAENDGTPVTEIVFTGDDILIDGDGAETEDGIELLIACGGVYRISGTASSARVVATAADTENITLILAGCDLTCADDEVYGTEGIDVAVGFGDAHTADNLPLSLLQSAGRELLKARVEHYGIGVIKAAHSHW